MTTTAAQVAGWLPAQVQALANLIVRDELPFIPLVEDDIDDQSISLRRMGDDAELGVIAVGIWTSAHTWGHDVILYRPHPDGPEIRTVAIVGTRAIIAAFHRYAMTGSLYSQA